MQLFDKGKPPVGVVLDCDMGHGIGDVLALALLYGLEAKNEARVVSVSVSNSNLNAAAYVDAVMRFYSNAPASGPFAGFSRSLPVGLGVGKPEDAEFLAGPLAKKKPDGSPVYSRTVHSLNDTAEVPALIRNALTSQNDGNCVVVLTGPATNLAKALGLPGVKELISEKVRLLCVVGGAYPEGPAEFNFKSDVAGARNVFAEWPSPIVALGAEAAAQLKYPASSIENDFGWAPAHPVVDAYRAYRPMPYDAPAGNMAAVLYAARTQDGFFKLSDTGTIGVLDDGRAKFTASAGGQHRYLIFDPAQGDKLVKSFTELASARPVVRGPRPTK
ncbi:MAG TPA: nucleoside hydrolase [Bryobacteraceae bacterium]|nr:nucleoside hydrolase [Bryobacteraceae bacterium]